MKKKKKIYSSSYKRAQAGLSAWIVCLTTSINIYFFENWTCWTISLCASIP